MEKFLENKLNMDLEENKEKVMVDQYKEIDIQTRVKELNLIQSAYLNKLLQGTSFRFQTEDDAKKSLSKMVREVSKQQAAKSKNNDSVSSVSDSLTGRKPTPAPKRERTKSPAKVSLFKGYEK